MNRASRAGSPLHRKRRSFFARGLFLAAGLGMSLVPASGEDALPPLQAADGPTIHRIVREADAEAVMVNVWATWCLPCREEFPDLLRLRREYRERGLELVLVSGDFSDDRESEVGAFLAQQRVDFLTYLKVGDDMEFIDALAPTWSGVLPATLLYDREGSLQELWEGRAEYSQMEDAVLRLIAPEE